MIAAVLLLGGSAAMFTVGLHLMATWPTPLPAEVGVGVAAVGLWVSAHWMVLAGAGLASWSVETLVAAVSS